MESDQSLKTGGWEQYLIKHMDHRVKDWPLMSTPAIPLSMVVVYLLVVMVGPRLMQQRQPFNLQPFIVAYNLVLVLMSAYMCEEFVTSAVLSGYSLTCQPVDYSNSPNSLRMARVCWLYYVSKYIELVDTVFFILRKKNNQISFLHVYHHATMILNWWLGVAYVAGGQSFFHPVLNTGVHVVMYTYYGLAALGPHWQKYLWWKKYLTTLQLTQFAIVTVHTLTNIVVDCAFPKGFNWAVLLYALSLIALFANFYRHAYHKRPPSTKSVDENGSENFSRNGLKNVENSVNGAKYSGEPKDKSARNGFHRNALSASNGRKAD